MPLNNRSRGQLVREIEFAFSDVALSDGIGFYEAWALDCYAREEERLEARKRDEKFDWDQLSDEEIARHHSVLCFVDTVGFRFLIPAFMRFTVRNYDKSDSSSVDLTIYALGGGWVTAPEFMESLASRQTAVIAKFIRQMVLDVGDDFVDADVASRAYENY